MFFIGDVHALAAKYLKLLATIPPGERSIQVGDLGIGFAGTSLLWQQLPNPAHKFIRGNHDNPEKCRQHPNYLGDWGYLEQDDLFYLSGAWSIDWQMRIEGRDWWREEELNIVVLNQAQQVYLEKKPRIVVTHDCPEVAMYEVLKAVLVGEGTTAWPSSRTAQALQQMFSLHQPEHHIFGHWHLDRDFKIGKTMFHCLNELSMLSLPTGPKGCVRDTQFTRIS